jgi:signal transduction histidine kinase
MLHQQAVAIPDIYRDDRIPVTAYRPTFVKSLLMVPIRPEDPIGAIGAYWADNHAADARERRLLETVAGFAALAVANAKLHQEARDAVRARDEWLGIASHELRTPLTPLKLQIESLSRALARGVSTVELGGRLRSAERSVGRLARLVEQLLDYRRFSGGTIALQAHDVELAALASEVCERFTDGDDLAPRGPIGVIAPGEVWCRCDRARVDQVLTNLVSNAQKYGQGQPITVEVEARDDRGGARISVSDRGPGIRPEDQERIFQPFARLGDGASQGVGLGLWIVRSLVQAHGGTIEVLSRPGAGTRVVVMLPSARPLAAV